MLLEESLLCEHHCICLLNSCPVFIEGDIQLVDGPTSYEGHLQVFYNGQWGYVCDDSWGDAEGIVVCRQLGYAPNLRGISTSTFYPISSDVSVVWKDSIDCVGNESQLNECQGANWVVSQCGLKEVAGVQCYADGKLVIVLVLGLEMKLCIYLNQIHFI